MNKTLLKKAESGDSEAQFQIGLAFQTGAKRDPKKALEWHKKAAANNHPASLEIVGSLYLSGSGVPINPKKGIDLIKKASENGNISSNITLGEIYMNGMFGMPIDLEEAKKYLLKIKHKPEAQYQLGIIEARKKQDSEAIQWMEKAVANKAKLAAFTLGYWYAQGIHVKKNPKQSLYYYTIAAKEGNTHSMYNLFIIYLNGMGIEKDEKKAIEWLQKAANKGNGLAELTIGTILLQGKHGVTKDLKKAKALFERASNKKDPSGHVFLGKMYQSGEGCEKDLKQALKHFYQAAELGNPIAHNLVAQALIKGEGTDKNLPLAYSYYFLMQKICTKSYPDMVKQAAAEMKKLEKLLSKKDIEKAKKNSSDKLLYTFKPKGGFTKI